MVSNGGKILGFSFLKRYTPREEPGLEFVGVERREGEEGRGKRKLYLKFKKAGEYFERKA